MNGKKKRSKKVKAILDKPFKDSRPNSAVIALDPIKTTSKIEKPIVTIALVAFKLPAKQYFDTYETGIFNKNGDLIENFELLGIKKDLLNISRKTFIKSINDACNLNANIICCSEMSYPFFHNKGQNTKLSKELQKISSGKGVYIIAGTYHDILLTSCNCCPIFVPEQDKHYLQYKLIPSRTQERNVRSASNMKILGYETEFGHFSISICYDAYSSDVKDLYKYSYNRKTFINRDFIFNPSYNNDVNGGIEHCKSIRDESKAVVFFVNDLSFRVGPLIFTPEGGEIEPLPVNEDSGRYKIYLYTINLEDHRKSVQALSSISPR